MESVVFCGSFLVYDDFLYEKNKTYKQSSYFRCKNRKCLAKFTVSDGKLLTAKGNHKHQNHASEILKIKTDLALKEKVIN